MTTARTVLQDALTFRKVPVERLLEVLSYEPSTGVIVWRAKTSKFGSVRVGSRAGCINKKTGHRLIRVDGVLLLAHRVAWAMHYGEWPSFDLDHKNEQPDDNRIDNLRECTAGIVNEQNTVNPRAHNTSGIAGVVRVQYRTCERWLARIAVAGKSRYLGSFGSPEAAREAYVQAKVQLHPAFASRCEK